MLIELVVNAVLLDLFIRIPAAKMFAITGLSGYCRPGIASLMISAATITVAILAYMMRVLTKELLIRMLSKILRYEPAWFALRMLTPEGNQFLLSIGEKMDFSRPHCFVQHVKLIIAVLSIGASIYRTDFKGSVLPFLKSIINRLIPGGSTANTSSQRPQHSTQTKALIPAKRKSQRLRKTKAACSCCA